MKNVKENQLKKAIFLEFNEFKKLVLKLTDGLKSVNDENGIYFEDTTKAELTGIYWNEDIYETLSKHFGVKVTSVHSDSCDYLGVWIVYKEDDVDFKKDATICPNCGCNPQDEPYCMEPTHCPKCGYDFDSANNLKSAIIEDCKLFEKLHNEDKILESYLYLNECKNSKDNGLYQLILNGNELWYGTLQEINAVIKSMITRIQKNDFLDE